MRFLSYVKHDVHPAHAFQILKFMRFALVLVCVLLLNACGTLTTMELDSQKNLASHSATIDLQTEVDSLAKPLIAAGETPGLIVGVLTANGEMRFFGYGTVGEHEPLTPDADTLFPIGSLSKGYLGAIAASLVEDGVLSWNDTLEKSLPTETSLSPDAKKITLLQLASHTSGLPRQPFTFQMFRYMLRYTFTGDNFYTHLDTQYVLNYLSDFSAPKKIEPQYSNIGYGLLGYVIELHSGKKLDALLQERIVQPLGLKNTGYDLEKLSGIKNRAYGHAGDQPKFVPRGEPVPDWHFTEILKGSAAVYSSARDLLIFADAHMTDTKSKLNAVLSDTLKVRYQRERDAPAIAWVVDKIEDQHITYQVGLVAGYTSYLGLDVERHTAVVVLQNSFNWNNKIGHKLLNRLAHAKAQNQIQTQARLQ